MPGKGIPEFVQTLFDDELFGPYSNVRSYRPNYSDEFRKTFPRMSKLLSQAESFRFDRRKERRQLLGWRTKSAHAFGWVCRPPEGIPKRVPVIAEHRLLCSCLGTIEQQVGWEVRPGPPWGDGDYFFVPRYSGLSETEADQYEWYLNRSESDSLPASDGFVVFGVEGNGDLWTYTLEDKRVFHIAWGGGTISGVPRRVEGSQMLYQIEGGETFTEFVEYVADSCLKALKHRTK